MRARVADERDAERLLALLDEQLGVARGLYSEQKSLFDDDDVADLQDMRTIRGGVDRLVELQRRWHNGEVQRGDLLAELNALAIILNGCAVEGAIQTELRAHRGGDSSSAKRRPERF